MIVDGRAIAQKYIEQIRERISSARGTRTAPILVVIQFGSDAVTNQFIGIKSRVAERAGVVIRHERVSEEISTEDALSLVARCAGEKEVAGIIIQLPVPAHIDQKILLDSIPPQKDPDLLSSRSLAGFAEGTLEIMPPVVSAIGVILSESGVVLQEDTPVLVIGQGQLVGKPTVTWLRQGGVEPVIATRSTVDLTSLTKKARVIISGAGTPGLITSDMISPGVVIVDAGTSEQSGKIKGDADPECAEKCSVFTPVPGGVGPVAVAMLFYNLLILWE